MSTVDAQLVRRNATLSNMVALLRDQHAAKLDVVVPATGLRSSGVVWEVAGTGPAILGPDGVTATAGRFIPTGTCDAGMADKLGIPVAYLRRLPEEHLGLYDANVNGWLEQQPARQLLIRTLRSAPTSSITCATLGAAGSSTSATWTASPTAGRHGTGTPRPPSGAR